MIKNSLYDLSMKYIHSLMLNPVLTTVSTIITVGFVANILMITGVL